MTMIVSAVIDRIFSFSDNLTTDHILAKLDQMLLSHLKLILRILKQILASMQV